MKAFVYTLYLKSKLDIKSAEMLITYYLVPLMFFGVMGAVFTSINPESKETLIASMSIFAITMGAFIGTPSGLLPYFSNDMRKTFKCAGIPLRTIVTTTLISGFVNLSIVSLIIYLVSPVAFGGERPDKMAVHMLGISLLLIVSLMLGITLGLYTKSSSKLTMISQIVFLPSLMLSGIMFPANMLPKPLEYFGHIFPATSAMKILTGQTSVWGNYIFPGVIFVITLVLITLRLRKYRYEDV